MTEGSAAPPDPTTPFRVAFVPGVTPGKWSRIWEQRLRATPLVVAPIDNDDQLAVLWDDRADMCLVRLPVDRAGLKLIPLYVETPVVVAPKDHPITAYEEVSVADLADEHLLQNPDDVPEWRDVADEVREGTRPDLPAMSIKEAIETVAAGTGIVIVPMSVARLHHRKDLTYRPVTDAAESQIGLAWLEGNDDPRIETFIGIVRGRTERSSRAEPTPPTPPPTKKKPPVKPAKAARAKHPAPRNKGKRPTRGRKR